MGAKHIVLTVVIYAVLTATVLAQGDKPQPVHVYMPDGQLISHPIRVYVTGNVGPAPRLTLRESHLLLKDASEIELAPFVVASSQWTEDDQNFTQNGTLLLFDMSGTGMPWFKAMMRVTPRLSGAANSHEPVVGPGEVNIGNIVGATVWTLGIVVVALGLVIGLARRANGVIRLLTGVDGHLSLAQSQVACWTIVVGSLVLGYGLIRFRVPEIPASLVVLMGASLATGGMGFLGDSRKQGESGSAADKQAAPRMADLLSTYISGQPEPSLAKAQMLFWTLLLVVLFISKSLLDGVLWAIPWPLVALMGFSQAGYLAPKFVDTPPPQASGSR